MTSDAAHVRACAVVNGSTAPARPPRVPSDCACANQASLWDWALRMREGLWCSHQEENKRRWNAKALQPPYRQKNTHGNTQHIGDCHGDRYKTLPARSPDLQHTQLLPHSGGEVAAKLSTRPWLGSELHRLKCAIHFKYVLVCTNLYFLGPWRRTKKEHQYWAVSKPLWV